MAVTSIEWYTCNGQNKQMQSLSVSWSSNFLKLGCLLGSLWFPVLTSSFVTQTAPAFDFAGLQEAVVEAPAHRVVAISHSEPR
jgi:hypothetical protein